MIQSALPVHALGAGLAADKAVVAPRSANGLRVVQVSTSDLRGGAARAAHRLHRALGGAGTLSHMLVAQRFGADADVLEYNPFAPAPPIFGRTLFRLSRRLHRPPVDKAGAYFTTDWTLTGRRLASQVPDCDVVNLHWVADLLDYRALPKLAAKQPWDPLESTCRHASLSIL